MPDRLATIAAIQKFDPSFDGAQRSDAFLAGVLGTYKAHAQRSDAPTVERRESVEERIDQADANDPNDPNDAARDRMIQRRVDAAKRTGLPSWPAVDPEAAAAPKQPAPAERGDSEDPEAARARMLARLNG